MGLLRQSTGTFLSRMTITLINIPISMIIARTLGAEGQGIYSAAVTFPSLWAGFGLLGIDAAHTYFLARDRRTLGPVVANTLLCFLLLSLVLVPTYLWLVRPMLGERAAAFDPYLVLSAIVVPLITARLLFMGIFLAMDRIETYNLLMVVGQAALLVLVAAGLLLAGRGIGFVIVAYQVSAVVFLVPALIWLRRQLRESERTEGRLPVRPSRDLMRDSLAYGLKGHLGAVLTQFTYRFDMVLVLRWLGTAAQGYYSIAVILAEKLTHITASVQIALFPRISASTREQADEITPMVCRNTLIWVTLAGLVLFALGRFLLVLFYSEEFLPALSAYQVLLPGIVSLTVAKLLSSDLSGRNRRVLPTVAMTLAFLLNLGLNFLWIPRFGIVGAALASTTAYFTQSLLMAIFWWRVTGISPHHLVVPQRGDLAHYRAMWERVRRGR